MEAGQLDFAYKVRRALNKNLDNLPASTFQKLASARNAAIGRRKRDSSMGGWTIQKILAGNVGRCFGYALPWARRLAFAVPVIVVTVGLAGIWQSEQRRYLEEAAEIEALVLADELPLAAYLDNGFNAYLDKDNQRN
jgi:hypothetical protein